MEQDQGRGRRVPALNHVQAQTADRDEATADCWQLGHAAGCGWCLAMKAVSAAPKTSGWSSAT